MKKTWKARTTKETMEWSDFQVGDVVQSDNDLLLVISVSHKKLHLLALHIESTFSESSPGSVEIWNGREEGWDRVVARTELFWRQDEVV